MIGIYALQYNMDAVPQSTRGPTIFRHTRFLPFVWLHQVNLIRPASISKIYSAEQASLDLSPRMITISGG
jgi:hypothetical protein